MISHLPILNFVEDQVEHVVDLLSPDPSTDAAGILLDAA